MMPTLSSCTPPIKVVIVMIVAHPRISILNTKYWNRTTTKYKKLNTETNMPIFEIIRRGFRENDNNDEMAKSTSLKKVYFVTPCCRMPERTFTVAVGKLI